jgi:hypothetical protein
MTSPRSTDRSARSSERAVNALTKPLNVAVPAGVIVAGLLIGASWLVVVALVCWLGLSTATFLEGREAPRPTADPAIFAPPIAARLRAATVARASIRAAIEGNRSPLEDVSAEVDALVRAMQADAVRAQRIHEFLAQESPAEIERRMREENEAVRAALGAKLDAVNRLKQRLDGMLAELDHVVVTLQTVQAEILATDGLDDRLLAGQVSDLRENVQVMAAGLEEAFAETRALKV